MFFLTDNKRFFSSIYMHLTSAQVKYIVESPFPDKAYILGKYSNKAHVLYLAKHPILFPLLNPIVKSCPCPHAFSFGLKMINIKLLQNYAISKTGFKISKTSNKICQFVPLVLLYVPQTFELMQISQILQRCLSLYPISMNTSSLLYLVHGSISNFSMNNPG